MENPMPILKPGSKGEHVSRLHKVIQEFISKGYIDENLNLINQLQDEISKSFFGSATNSYVQATYLELNIPYGNEVNSLFFGTVQTYLNQIIASEEFKINGIVFNQFIKPIPNATVKLMKVFLKNSTEIATQISNADGEYSFSVDRNLLFDTNQELVDVLFKVTILGDPNEYCTETFYNIKESRVLDISVEVDIAPEIKTEYDDINDRIVADFPSNIDEDDSDFIASKIGESPSKVLNLILAKKYAILTGLDVKLFYAILNKHEGLRLESIFNLSFDDCVSYINFAIATNVIDHSYVGAGTNFYSQLAIAAANMVISNNESSKSKEILGNVFGGTELSDFLEYFYLNNNDYDVLEKERLIQELTFFDESKYEKFNEVLRYSVIAGNNPVLVNKLNVTDTIDLVAEPLSFWENEINIALQNNPDSFVFPDYLTSSSQAEKISEYAEILKQNVDAAFPHLNVQKLITTDNSFPLSTLNSSLSTFTISNPDFNILKTNILELEESNNFDFGSIDKSSFINEVATIQRVNAISGDMAISKSLIEANYKSASEIVLANRDTVFADLQAKNISVDKINDIIAVSNIQYMYAASASVELATQNANFAVQYSPKPDANPEWRTLFPNTLDICCCDHCSSVFSPAAYKVDSLEILRRRNLTAYNLLKAKRGDLWQIELSCKNTNTQLPYIDIANEVLEDLTLASHAGTTTMPVITAYNTNLDEKTLDAIPEYIKTSGTTNPYTILKNAKYPWTAPYNFYYDQIKQHLSIIDAKPIDIALALSPEQKPHLLSNIEDACVYLDISNELRTILLDSGTTNLTAYYGVRTAGSTQFILDPLNKANQIAISGGNLLPSGSNVLNRVDIFLQQSGECYKCLLELLDCYYLNPIVSGTSYGSYVRKMKIESIVGNRLDGSPIPADTCDLSELKITGLDNLALQRIHTFVRLYKKLGWTKYQMDKVLRLIGKPALGAITDTDIVKVAQLKRISELLDLQIDEILLFWRPIEDEMYSSYSGDKPQLIQTEYEFYYRNPQTIPNLNAATDYPFPARLSALQSSSIIPGDATAIARRNYFLGATSITQNDFQLYIEKNIDILQKDDSGASYPRFNNLNLTIVLREEKLKQCFGLDTKEWLFYRTHLESFTGSPFQLSANSSFEPMLDFAYQLNQLKKLQIDLEDLNTLFFDEYSTSIDLNNRKEELTGIVNNLKQVLAKNSESTIVNQKVNDDLFKKKYGTILSDKDVDLLLNGVGKKLVASEINQTDKDSFNTLLPSTLSNAEKDVVRGKLINAGTNFLNTESGRFLYIDSIFAKEILNNTIVKYFETLYRIPAKLVSNFLNYTIDGLGVNTFSLYNSNDFIESVQYTSTSLISSTTSLTQKNYYQRIDSLSKLALLVKKFGLSSNDIELLGSIKSIIGIDSVNLYLLPTGKALHNSPNPPEGSITVSHWLTLLNWLYVSYKLRESKVSLFSIIDGTNKISGVTNRKTYWFENISQALGISEESLRQLVGVKNSNANSSPNFNRGLLNFDFDTVKLQNSASSYLRILNALDLADSLEIDIETLSMMLSSIKTKNATNPYSFTLTDVNSQNIANKVVQIVKSKFSNSEWLSIIKPVNDRLRISRRDAMVNYLTQYPPIAYSHWITSNDIYESIYIDTQMMPIVKTSRIRLNISSTQIFINRCVLQQERSGTTLVTITPEDNRQWNLWRKYYRVWEANRKVFIYPENWIEPELRDDKSPFFKDLEKYLKQNEISNENMRDAFESYLEKLEEVSNLEIVATYTEFSEILVPGTGTNNDSYSYNYNPAVYDPFYDIVHVWGRTHSQPHIFYYRKRVQNEWTAWEKMNIEIEGDHFCAVRHHGRLKFFWLSFLEKTHRENLPMGMDKQNKQPSTYYEVFLNWTEFKNEKWQPTNRSKNSFSTKSMWVDPEDEFINKIVNTYEKDWNWQFKRYYTQEYYDIAFSYMKSSMSMYTTFINGSLEVVVDYGYLVPALNASVQGGFDAKIGVTGWMRNHPNGVAIRNANKDKILEHVRNHYCIIPYPAEEKNTGVFNFETSKKVRAYTKVTNASYYDNFGDLHKDNFKLKILNNYNLQAYRTASGSTPLSWNSVSLNEGKSRHLVVPKNIQSGYNDGTLINHFFYEDFDNTFFIERNNGNSFKFTNFRFGSIKQITRNLNSSQDFTSFFDRKTVEGYSDNVNFPNKYLPISTVNAPYPISNVVFDFNDPNSIYAWELFFHIPMLIANKLMKDQKFFEAMQWYHYVFNPYDNSTNSNSTTSNVERFWNFKPFYDESIRGVPTITTIMSRPSLTEDIKRWAANPFKPHLVARTRISAYMKNVVMKYIDNLISWGDMLFRRDTMESINEATLLYIMAAQILGKKPNSCIPARASTGNKKYQDFVDNPSSINAFSNALQRVESVIAPTGMAQLINNPLWIEILPKPVLGGSGITTVPRLNTGNTVSVITSGNAGLSGISVAKPPIGQVSQVFNYKDSLIADQRVFIGNWESPKRIMIPNPNVVMMYYFCIPQNEKLLAYWDLVADRLFKIRNSQNIEGVERQLALFEPPIDPAILVKAVASGMSLTDAISDLYAPMPTYRFQIMVQKASELAQEVKSLGQSLLSALEKKDAESIALLRSTKEIELLEMVKDLRAIQIKEAQHQLASLQQQEKMITLRRDFYNTLISGGLNEGETSQLDSMKLSIPLKTAASALHALSGFVASIPDFKLGSPFSMGATFGGANISRMSRAAGDVINILATINDIQGSMAGIKGGYARREAEWKNQLKTANIELKQMEKQLLASQIRVEMAQFEYNNHLKQIDNAKSIDEAMHNKYTNEDLYDWMIGEISSTYFQSYKLAFDTARKAERCYHFELATDPANSPSFIEFGYWDSLRKGLLAGEKLLFDTKRMDIAYLDNNKRLQEMTKHISLAQFFPEAILNLKKADANGNHKIEIDIPEWIFDMDHPGQYLRRIKSVSISIPCVAGPYTTVAAKLTLTKNRIRKSTSLTPSYQDKMTIANPQDDERFMSYFLGGQSIATSSAQNDSGMFELNFKDERYLPFEGAGVISTWVLEIPKYAQFDINSISDVIFHINYTAKYDGGLKLAANANIDNLLAQNNSPLPRVFNLKQEFTNEWNAFVQDVANNVNNPKLKFKIDHGHFPQFCKEKELEFTYALVGYQMKDGQSVNLANDKLKLIDSNLFKSTADVSVVGEGVLSAVSSTTTFTTSSNKNKLEVGAEKEFQLALKVGTSETPISEAELNAMRDVYLVLIYKK